MNLRFLRVSILPVAIAFFASGCNSPEPSSTPHVDKPASAAASPSMVTKTRKATVSTEATDTLIGIIADSRLHPDRNAVDIFATGFHWKKTPPEANALGNAKVGYAGKIRGQTALLGGDGTNDIFSIALGDGFQPAEVVAELNQVYSLNKQDTEDSDGQRYDTYIMVDHGNEVGLLTLTYGMADAIRGAGTISFIGMDRVRKELAGHKGEP
jgi:hypothetical protein